VTYENISVELTPASVGAITLNRPDSLNALTSGLLDEMRDAVTGLPGEGARCLLLTGAGRGFSSGADLASSGGLPEDVGLALEQHFNPLMEAIAAAPVPVVAAVNGPAAGAGREPGADGGHRDRRAIGLLPPGLRQYRPGAGRRRDLAPPAPRRPRPGDGDDDAGRAHPGGQGAEWGMISRAVEDEFLAEEATLLATTLARGPTRALGLIRRLARDAEQLPLTDALAAERVAQREAGETEDFRRAVFAFLQKRQPTFEGR
jgi:2-(1,2-epoxy-1,2-dihydrophenyl)acetyl-CoA isomerase